MTWTPQIRTEPGLSDGVAMIGGMTEYTYRADWSHETREYLGQCLEFPYLWWRALTPEDAIAGVAKKVAEEVAAILAIDGRLPEPLTDRRYSGKFMVRASPVLHARLAVEAAEQGVSLNQWVVQKLAARLQTSYEEYY